MRETCVFAQALSALGIATFLAACSNPGSSGAITPSGVAPHSQTRPAQRAASPDAAVEYVYVTNDGDRSISAYKINATTGALTHVKGLFSTGTYPYGLAVDPSGKFAYVTNYGDNTVSGYSINATTGALKRVAGSPFAVGIEPYGLAVDPTGKFVYVANSAYFGQNDDGSVSAFTINATSGTLTPVFGSPFAAHLYPFDVVVDPKGKFVYVTNRVSDDVSAYKINATSGALKQVSGSPFAAGITPANLAVDPSGRFAYVPNNGAGTSPSNVSAYQISATSGALSPVLGSPFGAGYSPSGAVVVPTGKFVYVTNAGGNVSAYQINATSGALTQVSGSPFGGGNEPQNVTVDPTGTFAYTANYGGNNVSGYQINASSGALTQLFGSPFAAGKGPVGIASCRVTSGKCIPQPL